MEVKNHCCRYLILSVMVFSSGCITIKTVNISQKTSLENQLMGAFQPLSKDELLLASVRVKGDGTLATIDSSEKHALEARQRQLFNQDEVAEYAALGCVGEKRDATLAIRDCAERQTPQRATRLKEVVAQENADRMTLIDWAIAHHENISAADRSEVVAIYRRMRLRHAQEGTWIQQDTQRWQRKARAQP